MLPVPNGAQATAQSERIMPWLVANRFQAISQFAVRRDARAGTHKLWWDAEARRKCPRLP